MPACECATALARTFCSMHPPPPLGFATVALDAYLRHAEAHLTLSAGLPQPSVAAYYPPRLPPPGIPLAVPQPSAAAPARHLMLTSLQLPNRNPNQVVLDENRFEHLHRYEKLLQECAKELTTSPHSDRLLTARPFTSSPPASAVEAAAEATRWRHQPMTHLEPRSDEWTTSPTSSHSRGADCESQNEDGDYGAV